MSNRQNTNNAADGSRRMFSCQPTIQGTPLMKMPPMQSVDSLIPAYSSRLKNELTIAVVISMFRQALPL
jgi:hypothetical protein